MTKLLTSWIANQASEPSDKGFNPYYPQSDTHGELFVCEATEENLNQAIQSAQRSFKNYKKMDPSSRSTFLKKIGEAIDKRREQLIKVAPQETALPEARIAAECGRTVAQINLFAETILKDDYLEIRKTPPLSERTPPRPDLRMMKVPLGPVAVFGASNFPLAFSVAGGDTVSALAAGCPVIFKAHPSHPETSNIIAEAITEVVEETSHSSLDIRGVFSLIHSSVPTLSKVLVMHPHIHAVGFTGSRKVGSLLQSYIHSREKTIPFYAEMSSVNPIFFLPSIENQDMDSLVKNYVESLTLGCGQFCTNPGLSFVLASTWDKMKPLLQNKFKTLTVSPMLNQNIYKSYNENRDRFSSSKKITVVAEGQRSQEANTPTPILFSIPSVDFQTDDFFQSEVFGPAGLFVICDNIEQMKASIPVLEGQLTATIFGDEPLVNELMEELEEKAGRLIFNQYPTGVEVCDAMVHGGPYPATSDVRTTSVGSYAIDRFLRPICFQNFPSGFLPQKIR